MQKMIWLIVPVMISLCIPVSAEFYKYTDQNGNIRFSDDLSSVPENQRPNVKRYEESVSTPSTLAPEKDKPGDQRPDEKKTTAGTDFEAQGSQLQEKKGELDRAYQTLMKEKAKLETEAKTSKTTKEAIQFNEKVSKLNKDISEYDQKRNALNAEIETFNAKMAEKEKEKP